MLDGIFLYNILSIVIGLLATMMVSVLHLKARRPGLLPAILTSVLLCLIVLVLASDDFALIKSHMVIRGYVWESTNFLILGLCFSVPRLCRPATMTRRAGTIENLFAGGAVAFALLKLASYAIPSSILPVAVYVLTYIELSLVILYFVAATIIHRNARATSGSLHHFAAALTFTRIVSAILLPAMIAVDFFGFLLPFMARLIPQGFYVMPLFYIFFSLSLLFSSILEILAPAEAPSGFSLQPGAAARYALTMREAEIAPFVVECLSYQEIADRLFISPSTVRSHITHLYQKTGTDSRLELSRLLRNVGGRPR